ncbi:MAG: ABC transporter ATP-binding protein [Planctomycetota bacterium]|nr:ABC transporter ATP-binding protein [Planctomycetota bacterium]
MIEIQNLSKRFGRLQAVEDVTLNVMPGEVLGFLGPNGAGKSTTMKMITGFLSPDAGRVSVMGKDVSKDPLGAKSSIGYLPEGAPLYPDMTPEALLVFSARARGMDPADRMAAVDRALGLLELEGVRHQRIETLSKGFKRRVGLAQAILHNPDVLVLDEPTDGLDPNQKEQVRDLIRSMAQGKTIILSTHILEEVEAVCTRVAILSKGALCFNGSPSDLRKSSRFAGAVEIRFDTEVPADAFLQLSNLPHVSLVEPLDEDEAHRGFRIFPQAGQSVLHAVSDKARDRDWSLEDMHVDRGRLDDVFRSITIGHGMPSTQEEA